MIGKYKSPTPVEDKPIINTSFDNLKIINQIIERQKPKEVAAAAYKKASSTRWIRR